MSSRKGGLQRDIRSIFEDATMPDDILVKPPSETPTPTPTPPAPAAAVLDDPVDLPAEAEVEPDLVTPETAPEQIPVVESVPTPDPGPEAPDFSDRTIEGQMKKQRCEKDFSCYKSGLKDLCKARVIRKGKIVQCLEPKKKPCEYRIFTLFKRLCQCPIRIHIAKKHDK